MIRLLIALAFIGWTATATAQVVQNNCPANSSNCAVTATGSTTARTLAVRAAEVVNVRDHGVVCDGVTDDRAAMEVAFTAASAGTKKTVYFPPSSTICALGNSGSSLSVPDGVTLFAHPGTATLGVLSANAAPSLLLAMGDNTAVYGLTLDGGGATHGSANRLVHVGGKTNVTFDTVTFRSTRGIALLGTPPWNNVKVVNSKFTDIGNYWKTTLVPSDRKQAIAVSDLGTPGSGVYIIGNYFADIGLDAISIGNQTLAVIENNWAQMENGQLSAAFSPAPTAMSAFVYCVASVTDCVVRNNTIIGASGNAIDVSAQHNHVVGNTIVDSGQAGIGCFADNAGTIECSINSNTIRNASLWSGASSTWPGAISLGNASDNAAYKMVAIGQNTITDDASPHKTIYGIYYRTGTTIATERIDDSNVVGPVLTASIGGIITSLSSPARHPGYLSAYWYLPMEINAFTGSPVAPGANQVYCHAGSIAQKTTVTDLGLRVSTGGGNSQVAVYANGAWGRPGAKLISTGNIDTSTTGGKSASVTAKTLQPGLYWFCTNTDSGSAVFQSFAVTSVPMSAGFLGSSSMTNAVNTTFISAVTRAETFNTWPTFTSGTSWSAVITTTAPAVGFKVQ